ncbi:conserved hypothetical protein, partial [delta proteobacterium NaphS2]
MLTWFQVFYSDKRFITGSGFVIINWKEKMEAIGVMIPVPAGNTEIRLVTRALDMGKHNALMLLIVFFILACLNFGCSNESAKTTPQPEVIQGFAFFDLGANSHYSSAIRRKLGEKLGSDAISQQNVIDLTIYTGSFFKKHFPGLFNLNRELNLPEGQRIEHDTTKLMYRYARLKELPFKDIMLYFSNNTGNPLFFKISAGPGGAAILETLKK